MSMRGLIGIAMLLTLAACGNETGDPEPRAEESTPIATPTVMPTEIPVPAGPVRTGYAATVLDDGDGAELCLGGVMESLPPQCGGPKLVGWTWADHEGDFDESGGTRWGDFQVTGTFDGKDFTPTHVVPLDELGPPPEPDPLEGTLCPEPAGGWQVLDPRRTTDETMNQTFRSARSLEGYAGAWVDQSINPAFGDEITDWEGMELMNDPEKLIINVQVTGDTAAADAALREGWGGALCVSQAKYTERELRRIQGEVLDLPGMLSAGPSRDEVETTVIYDDGSIQAWADQEYGTGVVSVSSALVPAE